jgi:tRNA1Val (adenine37-N6)-methyltransferase
MKVCTDACILGAWAADKIRNKLIDASTVLDIGAGTGLLSLMLAQKSHGKIDAIEIEKISFGQAAYNFEQSPWSNRVHIFKADVKEFSSETTYSFIISNPPFYENDLLSPVENKNVAKHNTGLNINELIEVIKRLLGKTGSFAILIAYHKIARLEEVAKENYFFLREKLLIRPTPKHNYFRGVLLFDRQHNGSYVENELIIRNDDGNYSGDFIELMKDYYLYL